MPKRECAELEKIPEALAKTGFILEHKAAEEFKRFGWTTIGGRYYADDVDGRARELDLVAYRVKKLAEINVVTVVLVSCKKDEESTWAFMTKDKPKQDPNFDWNPVHYWTDVEPLRTYLASDSWKENYFKALGSTYSNNLRASRDIFAFQQISTAKVTPKNDKQIFDSISSLMKALDHELEALPSRMKGRRRLYNFLLVSVVDAPLVDVNYSGQKPVAKQVEKLTHLARYMVRRRELTALVHFTNDEHLPKYAESLTKFANVSARHMASLGDKAYNAIKSNAKIRNYFAEKLNARLVWRINSVFRKIPGSQTKIESIGLDYEDDVLKILIDEFDETHLAKLNSDPNFKKEVAKALREIARYEGAFVFAENIPF